MTIANLMNLHHFAIQSFDFKYLLLEFGLRKNLNFIVYINLINKNELYVNILGHRLIPNHVPVQDL